MKLQNKNSAYTILVSLMIIGFLIVVTTWILNLVLRESRDNKWQWQYLQSYGWAEAAMELALLKIKQNGYWVYDKKTDLDILKTPKSKIKISYDLNSKLILMFETYLVLNKLSFLCFTYLDLLKIKLKTLI